MLALLVGLGVAVRVWAYAGNASFWLDEILLARNIVGLRLKELLTRPLRLDQVAPRGFLLVEKLAVLGLGGSQLALRLFPFLCAVAGVFLFRRLAERALEGLAVPFALALFATGVPFIKQAAEVKQYALDATGAILLTLLAFDLVARAAPPGGSSRPASPGSRSAGSRRPRCWSWAGSASPSGPAGASGGAGERVGCCWW